MKPHARPAKPTLMEVIVAFGAVVTLALMVAFTFAVLVAVWVLVGPS